MLKTYQFKTHCESDSHSSKTANVILLATNHDKNRMHLNLTTILYTKRLSPMCCIFSNTNSICTNELRPRRSCTILHCKSLTLRSNIELSILKEINRRLN